MVITNLRAALFLFLFSIFMLDASAVIIRVTPDRTPVVMDETFQIHFDADGSVDAAPDFSPLDENFQILSTSQSSNFSMVNGQVSNTKRWSLTVLPRQAGTLNVPPISFGRDTSPAAVVEVIAQSQGATADQQTTSDIYLEATVSSTNPYVQSEVIYTLKLFRSVAVTRASLTDPEITQGEAVIEKIGDDENYEIVIDGTVYLVIERNYAIYPQASGEISIASVNFMGQVPRNRYGYDPFGNQPRTVVRRSEPVTLNVRQIPDTFQGTHWLPAKNVTLAEEWSGNPFSLSVGEPVTRTLILDAEGLTSSQLPELPADGMTNLRFYPDQPVLMNDKTTSGITSSRREKTAIIPGQTGNYTLPEISIPWWNTLTDKPEFAVLPERTIQVQAAAANNATDAVSPSLQNPLATLQPQLLTTDPTTDTPIAETGSDSSQKIYMWAAILLAALLFYVLVIRRLIAGRLANGKSERTSGVESVKSTIQDISVSCRQNDPVSTRENLLRWARLIWPESPPLNLSEIAARSSSTLEPELHKLNNVLYGNMKESWDGEQFWQVFKAESARNAETPVIVAEKGRLEPLYRL